MSKEMRFLPRGLDRAIFVFYCRSEKNFRSGCKEERDMPEDRWDSGKVWKSKRAK